MTMIMMDNILEFILGLHSSSAGRHSMGGTSFLKLTLQGALQKCLFLGLIYLIKIVLLGLGYLSVLLHK